MADVVRFVIAEREGSTDLSRRIDREVAAIGTMGAAVEVTREIRGGTSLVTCRLTEPGEELPGSEATEIFRFGIATAVAETILCDVEPRLLRRGLARRMSGAPAKDRRRALELARAEAERLGRDEGSERANLLERVCDYLSEEQALHLDGLVRFRMKEYLQELDGCVETALRRLEAEREHREFVALLHFLLENQEPRVELVHVLPGRGGSFSLLDGEGWAIDHHYLEGFVFDLAFGEVNLEDLLVSALVTLSPVRIVLHPPLEALDTAFLREVFAERLTGCDGCQLCNPVPLTAGKPRPK